MQKIRRTDCGVDVTHYHFIGIGGIGMSALARILLAKNCKVTGSDLSPSAVAEELMRLGALIDHHQTGESVSEKTTVIYSSDIKKGNVELQRAHALHCKLLHRSELLRDLAQSHKSLAVTGTHGKTTTSSLLLHVLQTAALAPTFAIGGSIVGATNGGAGQGEYFVLEADESDGSFLNYTPFGAIVTNVEAEHLDFWQSEKRLHEGFGTFMARVLSQDHLFYCADEKHLQGALGVSYGFSQGAQLRLDNFLQKGWEIGFDIHFEGHSYLDITVPLLGMHNALNAAAVFGLSLRLGIAEESIRTALKTFPGVKRRLEKKGEVRHTLLLDDYAHHPTEIEATLTALKGAAAERRLVALFQPHRYSRVVDFLEEFAHSFDAADVLFVTDIYAAREENLMGIDAHTIIERIKEVSTVPVSYLPRNQALTKLTEFLRPHDVFVSLGAGDVTAVPGELSEIFKTTPPRKYSVGLVFGGRSCEHEISLRSARYVRACLDQELYDVKYLGIDKNGGWIAGEKALEMLQSATFLEPIGESVLSPHIATALQQCDLFFPILHGPYGEDGTIQGFFEMLGKPYGGPDALSAAVTMDKVLTKKLLQFAGIPTPPFLSFTFAIWREKKEHLLGQIRQLRYPLFVKPTSVGSSVGISCTQTEQELIDAIEKAFFYHSEVLIEEGKLGCRELEFAVIGDKEHIFVPAPGEKCAGGIPVDYEMKYGATPVKTTITPTLSPPLLTQARALVRKVYETLGITGMARIDCLLDPDGTFWFFEVNGIPGMQQFSLFPKIWARDGLTGPHLIDRLLLFGLKRAHTRSRHSRTL